MSSVLKRVLYVTAALLALGVLFPASSAVAQTNTSAAPASVLPSGGGQALLDTADTVFILLDHQSGLLQTVKDVSLPELRTNVEMLGRLASLMKIPVITTASEPNGTNGPLIPEVQQSAPHAVYVPRKGE